MLALRLLGRVLNGEGLAAFHHRFLSFLFCMPAECILLAKAQGQNNGTATGGPWLRRLLLLPTPAATPLLLLLSPHAARRVLS